MIEYPGRTGDKNARKKVFAIMRYMDVVWDFVLNAHYSLENKKNHILINK